jgi:lipoprotein-anchoring transpeptidase ErfK/SrfK
MKTSLEHKTIRPGSLRDYSFYYSKRTAPAAKPAKKAKVHSLPIAKILILAAVLAAGYFGFHYAQPANQASGQNVPVITSVAPSGACAGNTLHRFIKVSIAKRQLWACQGAHVAYSTPVITGIAKYASTVTPAGTYKIYSKQQNTVLTGSDQTGSWRDPVSYWMPFLDNQYGTYGFHDATWRDNGQFGTVDPNSDNASHGCVELPLGAAKWLYDWSSVGTTLRIES